MSDRSSLFGNRSDIPTAAIEAQIPGMRRFAFALLRGDRQRADDLVQDSLVSALSRWHQLRHQHHLRAWLYTILFNRFATEQQRHRRRTERTVSIEVTGEELPGIDGGQEGAIAHRDLLRAFAILPDEHRSVLLLIGVEGLSYAEAAKVLGVPIGTVMSRLSRGRERLRGNMNGWRDPARQPVAAGPTSPSAQMPPARTGSAPIIPRLRRARRLAEAVEVG